MRGEGESGTHFQTDLCCPQNGEIPRYKTNAGRQPEILTGVARSRCGCDPRWSAEALHRGPHKSALFRVPCSTDNLRPERAELEAEQDLNSEPAQDKALGVAQCDKQNGIPNARC